MKQVCVRTVSIILWGWITFTSANAYAAYGQNCVSTGYNGTFDNSVTKNALIYLLNNIDIKDYTTYGCDNQPANQLQFCIRGQGTDPCELVTLQYGDETTVSAISSNPDIGGNPVIGNINLKVDVLYNRYLCLSMPTPAGLNPIICRNINEAVDTLEYINPDECSNIATSCYRGTNNSQSLLNFSGLTIQCLTESLDRVFFEGANCSPTSEEVVYTSLRPFPEFQESLKNAVRAALIIYVMFYGFRLVMDIRNAQLNVVVSFIIKFLLVAYFSVGLGPAFYDADIGQVRERNGMTEWALPALVGATTSFSQMVFKAAGSQGLCQFDPDKYNPGYEYYALWDAIDCRLGFYLGMQAIYNMSSIIKDLGSTTNDLGYTSNTEATFDEPSDKAINVVHDAFNFAIFTVLFGFLMAGNILLVICGLVVAIMFLSVMFYFLTTYIVCTVTLYVLAYVSPIFVPMALFDRTKGYFQSWLSVTLSVVLQPAVVAGFIALLLTFYDTTIFGTCEYRRHDYTFGEYNFSTFEIRIPTANPTECTESPGYGLVRYYAGSGWDERILIIFAISVLKDVWNLATGMVYVLIFLLIFYFVLQYISEFASDLTSGPSVESAVVSATFFVDAAMKAASKAANASGGKQDVSLPEGGGGDDGKKRKSDMGQATGDVVGGDASKATSGKGGGSGGSGGAEDVAGKVSGGDKKGG